MKLILKTPLGLEKIVASRVLEIEPSSKLSIRPMGMAGLVIIEDCSNEKALLDRILKDVPEVESVVPVEVVVPADIDSMVSAARKLVEGRIKEDESFAVRTVRRGKHGFSSIDVNIAIGSIVQSITGAKVDLENPDKIVQVEIIQDRAALAILNGFRWRKMGEGKKPSTSIFEKISIVQMPYLGSLDGAREIGMRIGRAVQAYEVKELIISPNKAVDALELAAFIRGVEDGIMSRLSVQKRCYAREIRKVKVYVQDLYQLVRERAEEPLIVFEPEGIQLKDAAERLLKIFNLSDRVNFLFGSREGIPKGVYRVANLILDLAPGLTLPTELAAPSALAAVYTALSMVKDLEENG